MKRSLLLVSVLALSVSFTAASAKEYSPLPFGKEAGFVITQDAPVYPNPARDHIFIRPSEENFSASGDLNVEIRNILGTKMPVRLEQTNQGTFRVSLANYPSGYYMLVLQCEHCGTNQRGQKEIHKFLKQ